MVLMALDHTRDFFSGQLVSLADPSHLTLPYFFTRWITHLCAPAFVFRRDALLQPVESVFVQNDGVCLSHHQHSEEKLSLLGASP